VPIEVAPAEEQSKPIEPVQISPVEAPPAANAPAPTLPAEVSKEEVPKEAVINAPVTPPAPRAPAPTTPAPANQDERFIFRLDRNLDAKNLQGAQTAPVEPSVKAKVVEEKVVPAEDPGYFERMLEKIGF
jgi:outer membrane protein assembly factor BamE